MAHNTMKYTVAKGLFALAMFVALAFVCATPAFAATGSLKVLSEEGSHPYQAFKLFSCTVDSDNFILNVSTNGCMPADFYADAFMSSNAQEMAEEVSRQISGPQASAYAAALSKKVVAHREDGSTQEFKTGEDVALDTGVYMLISHDAQPILVTVGNDAVVVNEKSTLPSVSKEISSAPKSVTSTDNATFASLATTGVAQQLTFHVTGTLPSNYEAFDAYRYAFVDTPSKGIVVDPSSVVVSLIDELGKRTNLSQGYTVAYDQGILRVAFDDLKQCAPGATAGSKIELSYRATLDTKNAEFGFDKGNPNSVAIEYRRSPSYDELGTTKPSVTTAYSFALNMVKVDANNTQKTLSGARFDMFDEQGNLFATATTDEAGSINIVGIAPGTYQLKETAAPTGYQPLEKPITVVVKADADTRSLTASVTSDAAKLTNVDASKGTVSISVSNEQLPSGLFSKTGDIEMEALFGLALVAFIAGMTIIVIATRNKRIRN